MEPCETPRDFSYMCAVGFPCCKSICEADGKCSVKLATSLDVKVPFG